MSSVFTIHLDTNIKYIMKSFVTSLLALVAVAMKPRQLDVFVQGGKDAEEAYLTIFPYLTAHVVARDKNWTEGPAYSLKHSMLYFSDTV
jgi:hypothetical protein